MPTLPSNRYGPGALGPYVRVTDIASDVNDFFCEGWQDCQEVHLSATLPVVITGFYAVPGRYSLVRLLHNVGSEEITLTASDAASEVANRIFGTDIVLLPNTSVVLIYDYTLLGWRVVAPPSSGAAGAAASRALTFTFQNTGIQLDVNAYTEPLYIPFNCEIYASILLSFDVSGTPISGNLQLVVYKGTYASYPPSASIVAAAKPTLTAQTKSTDLTLTGWTKTLAEGDLLMAKVDSVSGITGATLILLAELT